MAKKTVELDKTIPESPEVCEHDVLMTEECTQCAADEGGAAPDAAPEGEGARPPRARARRAARPLHRIAFSESLENLST
jgi:hypothetical protein